MGDASSQTRKISHAIWTSQMNWISLSTHGARYYGIYRDSIPVPLVLLPEVLQDLPNGRILDIAQGDECRCVGLPCSNFLEV